MLLEPKPVMLVAINLEVISISDSKTKSQEKEAYQAMGKQIYTTFNGAIPLIIKATPNSRFSASVNLGSSKYFQSSFNQINTANFLNNTLSSSISYSKTFTSTPQVNMSLTASHSQNTNTGTINMTLPTLQVGVDRIFPFAPKNAIKKGFIKNVNLSYSLRGENRIATVDSLFFKPEMFRDAKKRITTFHSVEY